MDARTQREVMEAKYIYIDAGVRYWEDGEVNGVEDTDGTLMPFIVGDRWTPVIEIATGQIQNWPHGTTAHTHYKVCDDGSYYLRDAEGNTVGAIEDDYVPSILDPTRDGYGDYLIFNIDVNGFIENWKVRCLDEFEV